MITSQIRYQIKIAVTLNFKSLADLFSLSITTNTFPDDWKVTKGLSAV